MNASEVIQQIAQDTDHLKIDIDVVMLALRNTIAAGLAIDGEVSLLGVGKFYMEEGALCFQADKRLTKIAISGRGRAVAFSPEEAQCL